MSLRLSLLRSAALLIAFMLAGCGDSADRPVEVAVIGDSSAPFQSGSRLPLAAQLVRSATVEGLVGIDEQGRVIPALADRWIVTDDGQSYIFRLRDGTWPDGSSITGDSARAALLQAIAGLRATPLGADLTGIRETRAMAGRVIEIRLNSPVPDLLQLLAQPELGLARKTRGTGPMKLSRAGKTAVLKPIPPEDRGLPNEEDWARRSRLLHLNALSAATAIERFDTGDADIVLGGRIEDFPRLDIAGLSRGAIRLDPVSGLFGLAVLHADGFLVSPANREAIAMAIDRDALIAAFSVGGWTATNRIVSPGAEGDPGLVGERWSDMSLNQRRSVATSRVSSWRGTVLLRIAMPTGPGADVLFGRLRDDLRTIGIESRRVGETAAADLRLIDQVARYPRASWFLNQLSCANARGLCNSAADTHAAQALAQVSGPARAALQAEAEAQLMAANTFIPFGPPVRWSLVSGDVTGFAPNRWGSHPLMPLAMRPK
jgi:ABC-type transport system substrate-binding protein